MGISTEEIYDVLACRADEEVRMRFLKAIEEDDRIVGELLDQRMRRAQGWLANLGETSTRLETQPG